MHPKILVLPPGTIPIARALDFCPMCVPRLEEQVQGEMSPVDPPSHSLVMWVY